MCTDVCRRAGRAIECPEVREEGNKIALAKVDEVFETKEAEWRGLGSIPDSGYRFRAPFLSMDARTIDVDVEPPREHPECLCGEVLQGIDKHRHLLETLSDVVLLIRIPDGVYEYVSPAVEEVFGYPVEDFLNHS